jgi:hypothetical protein
MKLMLVVSYASEMESLALRLRLCENDLLRAIFTSETERYRWMQKITK